VRDLGKIISVCVHVFKKIIMILYVNTGTHYKWILIKI